MNVFHCKIYALGSDIVRNECGPSLTGQEMYILCIEIQLWLFRLNLFNYLQNCKPYRKNLLGIIYVFYFPVQHFMEAFYTPINI
jgi:hypothetical protein